MPKEYLIREDQMKELADIIREKFLLDYEDADLYLVADRRNLALTSLPDGLTSIGDRAFSDCTKLALTSIPEGITSIGSYAFQSCSRLTSLTFKGTPTSIASNAFYNCTNLTTINVPWSVGALAGAPWGATKATINYNYTGQ